MTIKVLVCSFVLVVAMASVTYALDNFDPTDAPNFPNRIVLIRHAEKGFTPDQTQHSDSSPRAERLPPPPSRWWPGSRRGPPEGPGGRPRGPPGRGGEGRKFPNGLSDKGRERAQYIRTLFGDESEFDFGLIFAAPFDAATKETERTYATVAPLAQDLTLKVNIDCANEDPSCIVKHVQAFAANSTADILICWKHFYLNSIATALGADNANSIYPDQRNDVIWIMEDGAITEKRSMHCPVLDDGRKDEGDPDLVVESPRKTWGEWWTVFWSAIWTMI